MFFTGECFGLVVGDVEHGGGAALGDEGHEVEDLGAILFVEAVAWFIEDEDFGGLYSGA